MMKDLKKTNKNKQKVSKSKDNDNYNAHVLNNANNDANGKVNQDDDILSKIPFAGNPCKSTISVAIPSSIVSNAQSFELRAYLVGQIARILTIFGVDEVIIYEDKYKEVVERENVSSSGLINFKCSKWMEFFVKNLKYLETPQYLRKSLFKFDSDLKFAGLQNPIDAPHHMRISEWLPYREGVVVSNPKLFKGSILPEHRGKGSWVNCGLPVEAWVDSKIDINTRITIKMFKESEKLHKKLCDEFNKNGRYSEIKSYFIGKVVSDFTPTKKKGLYWGYKVRPANSLKNAIYESEYEGGYDLKIGTSERGRPVDTNFRLYSNGDKPRYYKHLLIVFGGLGGLEEILSDPQSSINGVKDPSVLFDIYINICPEQKSRTIRTEEALGLTLSFLRPHILENNKNL